MSPEAEAVCARAIEAGAVDEHVAAFWKSNSFSEEERAALSAIDEALMAICGERVDLTIRRHQLGWGILETNVGRAMTNRNRLERP